MVDTRFKGDFTVGTDSVEEIVEGRRWLILASRAILLSEPTVLKR
jgi:hypothetical protein